MLCSIATAKANMLSVRKHQAACTSLHRAGSRTPPTHCTSRTNSHRGTRSWNNGHVLQSAADEYTNCCAAAISTPVPYSSKLAGSASGSTSAAPLSGLDLQDSWSASGLASSITAAQLKPSLSMRPITTHVNVLLAGSGHYLGKAPYYSDEGRTASMASAKSVGIESSTATPPTKNKPKSSATKPLDDPPVDAAADTPDANSSSSSSSSSAPAGLHAAFLDDPASWATQLAPVLLPEACREMVYKFQDSPGQGSTLDACDHVETLLSHLLQQQLKDYKQLCGSRGMNKSLACGCLQHSTTVCFYFLPPHGPSKVDLVAMSALSQHVALLPVMSLPEGASEQQASDMLATVRQLLQEPAAHVEGLMPIKLHKLSSSVLQLPLVLRAPLPASPQQPVLQSLVQLLSTDEVYGLLDDAWERYSAFCGAYEIAGKDLATMTRDLQGQLNQYLPSLAALQAAARDIHELENEIDEAAESKKRLAAAHAAALEKEKGIFTTSELYAAVNAGVRNYGYAASPDENIELQKILSAIESYGFKGNVYQSLKEKLQKRVRS